MPHQADPGLTRVANSFDDAVVRGAQRFKFRSAFGCAQCVVAVHLDRLSFKLNRLSGGDMAFDFRQRFGRDVVIDMYSYRRYGHNEGDEPSFTQPDLYAKIEKRPSVTQLYKRELLEAGTLSEDDAVSLRFAHTAPGDNDVNVASIGEDRRFAEFVRSGRCSGVLELMAISSKSEHCGIAARFLWQADIGPERDAFSYRNHLVSVDHAAESFVDRRAGSPAGSLYLHEIGLDGNKVVNEGRRGEGVRHGGGLRFAMR